MRKNAPVWFGGRGGEIRYCRAAARLGLPGIEAARGEFVIMGLRCFGVPFLLAIGRLLYRPVEDFFCGLCALVSSPDCPENRRHPIIRGRDRHLSIWHMVGRP